MRTLSWNDAHIEMSVDRPARSVSRSDESYDEEEANDPKELAKPSGNVLTRGFPWMSPKVFKEYKENQKKFLDVIAVSPIAACFYVNASTRLNLQNIGHSSILFSLAFALLLLCTLIFSIFFSARVSQYFWRGSAVPWKLEVVRLSDHFLLTYFYGHVEDVIGILGTLVVGSYMAARVVAGQCPSDDIWKSQQCNPYAKAHAIPDDQMLLLYAIPLMCQIVLSGFSVYTMFLCYALSFSFVLFSLNLVGGWISLWTLIYCLLFVNISFEFER